MAVTKMLVSVFVVLAITYNQGAARSVDPFITKNGLSSSEEFQGDSDGSIKFTIPTTIKRGLVITIKGTIDPNGETFIVELPSVSGKESCQIKFNYINDNKIYVTPAIDDSMASTDYRTLNVGSSGSGEGPAFSLRLRARLSVQEDDLLGMIFNASDIGPSEELLCKIDSFEDINQIVIRKGVTYVDSLLFEFTEHH